MISIIVPLYNCETFVGKCLDSLLAQDTKESYEVIVVDDGSTDRSLDLARGYEKDSRVKVFSKANEGPAMARNFGLEQISPDSKWVTFVDSDDYVEPTYLSTLLSVDGDIKVCSMFHHEGDRITPHGIDVNGVFVDLCHNEEFAALFPTGIMGAFWNKLFRTSIIRDNNLRIKDVRILEDIDFVFRYVQLATSVGVTSSPQYHYVHRAGSETSKATSEMIENYIILHGRMLGWFDKGLQQKVDEFVFPQYFALILRCIRKSDFSIPKKFIGNPMVSLAFKRHHPASNGERVLMTLLKLRLFGLVKKML